MAIEVVLLKKVPALGEVGEIVSVKEGYAQNFLLKNGLATLATEKTKKEAEVLKEKAMTEEKQKEEEMRLVAKKIKGLKLNFKKESKEGKLFGSITTEEIKEALKKEGVEVLEKQIEFKEKIKELGEFEAKIKLGKGITENIKIVVFNGEKSKK
jgi:large subunit ribosomal protein L9